MTAPREGPASNPRLDAALECARTNLVLPLWWTARNGSCACPKLAECKSPGKHPLTEHGLDDATSTWAQILEWWAKYPEANIGVRTDEHPRIDIDLSDAVAELSKDQALPLTTQVVRTPRPGMHIELDCPNFPSSTMWLDDGRKLGELKASRAYVVAPPSSIGGVAYQAVSPPDVPVMKVDDPVAWLAKVLPQFGFRLRTDTASRKRDYGSLGGEIYEGEGRHNALVSYAGRVWVSGMAAQTLCDLLGQINRNQCRPPLPQDELLLIADHFTDSRSQGERPHLKLVDQDDFEVAAPPYVFRPATSNQFVAEFIAWREKTNDAALEYAEAHAVGRLAALAGPRLKIPVRQKPRPISANLLMVLVGPSTVSRKSDVQEHTQRQVMDLYRDCVMDNPGSAEGFVQDLARHQAPGAVLFIDELAWWFNGVKRRTYLSELKALVMRAYDGSSISRRNRSKTQRQADGSRQMAEDADVADEPCLSIFGTSTPERLASVSSREDVEDGWWPRWVIIWPESRPEMRPMGPPDDDADRLRLYVEGTLRRLHARLGTGVQALLDAAAWGAANDSFGEWEHQAFADPEGAPLYSRMELRLLKVAALLAAVDDVLGEGNVLVRSHHVEQAAALCTRWLGDALRFSASVGLNEFEGSLNRAWRALLRFKGRRAPRREIARAAHVPAKVMDEIERTLVDRGLLETEDVVSGGRTQKVWIGTSS